MCLQNKTKPKTVYIAIEINDRDAKWKVDRPHISYFIHAYIVHINGHLLLTSKA